MGVIRSDVIDFSEAALLPDAEKGFALVFDVEPVADIEAVAIEGHMLIAKEALDKEGDDFFGVLGGAEIVGRAGDEPGKLMGVMGGQNQKIGSGFGSSVRTAGVKGRLFGKAGGMIQGKRTVHFIGGNMNRAKV